MNTPLRRRPSLLFQAVSLVAFLFILTVLIMVAALFSDPDSPLNGWFNRYGISLLLGEVAALFVLGFLAMVRDQGGKTMSNDESRNSK